MCYGKVKKHIIILHCLWRIVKTQVSLGVCKVGNELLVNLPCLATMIDLGCSA
jgi:hypothetical protein